MVNELLKEIYEVANEKLEKFIGNENKDNKKPFVVSQKKEKKKNDKNTNPIRYKIILSIF